MICLDFHPNLCYPPVGHSVCPEDIMKRQVRKVTKQLPAKSFTDEVLKLLFTKIPVPRGAVANA
jgi:hypothetical protein